MDTDKSEWWSDDHVIVQSGVVIPRCDLNTTTRIDQIIKRLITRIYELTRWKFLTVESRVMKLGRLYMHVTKYYGNRIILMVRWIYKINQNLTL